METKAPNKPNAEHLQAIINDLSMQIGQKTVEISSLRQGIRERDNVINNLKTELATFKAEEATEEAENADIEKKS